MKQGWDTGTGASSKLLAGADEAWDPPHFAFSRPVQTRRMARQSSVRNSGLFLVRDDIWQGF